jgi:hypothetical protein
MPAAASWRSSTAISHQEPLNYKSSRTFKEFVKQPPTPLQVDYYIFFDGGEEEKFPIFPLHHHQKICERGFFSYEKNPG